jgi:thiol-disulfide isomerase/thioredoxin
MSLFEKLRLESHLPGLEGATGWLNSAPLTAADLSGKVVLVDFWTYTCINWLRTLGYVRAWAEKYRDDGLVVVGVHTPEFPFEEDADNVRWAAKDLRVEYPIALDSDYAVWRAFDNNYWPAVYIADAEGRIKHHQFGEGGYRECEMVVQRLLREAGRDRIGDAWGLPRPTSATSRARTSRLRAAPSSTSLAPSMRRPSSTATAGRCQGTGRSDGGPACSMEPTGGSCFAFTPGTSISSWARLGEARPFRSECSSTESRPEPRTGATSTSRDRERSSNRGSIS